ncbi:Alanine-tRNA ligase [Phytophthora megakarya]|uniref:Alanine-tRNA ligase n=1 Tax=Phytophthora megakarya TaxID=4795 RepID=A0A225VWZ0_9STRA|nr:Alanine-tRNA ligase [Phytophthora megakarya]
MNNILVTLLALTSLLTVCRGADTPRILTDAVATPDDNLADSTSTSQSSDTQLNATVAGNNLLVTRSNIFLVGDLDKKGVMKFIKNLVTKGSARSDDLLTTQIIAALGADNSTSLVSGIGAKMMSKIKTALQNRDRPAQLRQIIVKLTEMSPKFGDKFDENDD